LQSLTLVDYLLHAGSENVILYFRENLYVVKTLREFQYIDEDGKDQGANVRQKAKDIVNLLQDDNRLRHERRTRAQMYKRMSRAGRLSGDSDLTDEDDENTRRRSKFTPKSNPSSEDEELRRAIEESKRSMERDRLNTEERDLQRALELSKEEEQKRAKAVADANLILFDEQGQPQPPVQTNPFPLVDATLPLQYATTGIQPQYTAMPMQPQYTAMPMQPQYTSFNPFQQQAEQEMMQAMYMQQQAEWAAQQQALEQAQQQAQQEEWLRQQQLSPLVPQPTSIRIGSNNPFASTHASPTSPPRETASAGPQLQQTTGPVSFNLTGTYANRSSAASAPPMSQQQPLSYTGTGNRPPASRSDEQHARLASLFANRTDDGVDTFGNVGQLRFVSTEAGRIVAQKTGAPNHNPFLQQNQQSQSNDENTLIHF